VKDKIREINPVCEVIESAMGEMDYSFMKKDFVI